MADLGATPVYVVNMPPGGFNNGGNPPDIPDVNDQKNPGKKKFSFGKLLQGAFFYPAVDYTADSLIGDTAFGKWAKSTGPTAMSKRWKRIPISAAYLRTGLAISGRNCR